MCYWSHKATKINSICIWRSIYICVDSGSTCKKAAMLHHLYIGSDKNWLCVRFCSFTFTWKQGHEHETPLNSTQSAFNLALGHAGRSRRTWWTWFERTFATTSSLQEQQERRQIVWDCFSRVRKNCPLAHTSGLDACRRHAESQSADGGRERVREGELKLQRAEFTWGNDANQAENVARVQIELEESGGFLSIFELLFCFSSWYVASSFLGEQSGHIPNSCVVINPKYTQTATPFLCNLSIQKEF